MGIQKTRTCLSFDAATVTIIDRCVARYAPLFDDNRSLAVRFMLKQYDKFMEAVASQETVEAALERLQLLKPINSSYAPTALQPAAVPTSIFPKMAFKAEVIQ